MAKPRIFISSTFYDLKHIRSSLENFIESLGYDPILSEKGSIAYNPDIPLDESCYKEAQSCDIYILIIGGRYGSPATNEKMMSENDFHHRYESITKMEYESAIKMEIPTYILIEKNVRSEYETFKKNLDNDNIKYAHVDSVNIFHFITEIMNQPKNNPIHLFEKHNEIETWLKQQWAGLFQGLIKERKNKKELSELSYEIKELSDINKTLKRYLEEIVSKTNKENGDEIIEQEEVRLREARMLNSLQRAGHTNDIILHHKITVEEIAKILSKSNTFEDLSKLWAPVIGDKDGGIRLLEFWNENEFSRKGWDEMRVALELPPLK